LRRVASFFIEMLAAIPSVVYGFWGVFVLAPLMQHLFTALGGPNIGGRGVLSASMILALMIVPYIAAITYDVCQAVPRSQREGALALGATRWQTIWKVVLPYARPGIIAGAFLALGRALGETMAVTMLIGSARGVIQWQFWAKGDSIASILANQYLESDTELFRSVLVELALLLFVVTVILNASARVLMKRLIDGKGWWTSSKPASNGAPATPPPPPTATAERANRREEMRAADNSWLSGQRVDRIMTGVLGSCVVFTMGLLVVILSYLSARGLESLNWAFFTELPGATTSTTGGLAHAIVGSLKVVGWAAAFAVPIGLLAAIYLAEYRPGPLGNSARFIAELLGGVPSIVVGIFAAGLFRYVSNFCDKQLGHRITFYGWSGVFALAVIMVPIVMRAAEEALKLVPSTLRNASFALGASHAQTVLRVTVPAALPAIVTAIFLSIARIAGETAPLLITAGTNQFWPDSLNDFTPTLPPYIWKFATSSFPHQQQLAWSGAFVLMAIVLLLNFGIRLATGKRQVLASRAD
jgi:phosphate transport system permease protein